MTATRYIADWTKAINEIGWTGYHVKLFCLNGFGFAVDSLLTFLVGIANTQVVLEFGPSYPGGAQLSLYVGMLFGALGTSHHVQSDCTYLHHLPTNETAVSHSIP